MLNAPSAAARRPRASPSGRPPPPPRVVRADTAALGLALVAALDEPPSRPLHTSPFRRPRSDSTLSTDTFDGIYALGDDDVGSVDVDDVDMDDLDDLDHVDAFRPSKLDDEFGRPSDLERMLLGADKLHAVADSEEPTARDDHMDVHVDEDEATAVMAHLARLDAQQKPPKQQQQSGFCALVPSDGRRIVVPTGAGCEMADALPPRGVEIQRRVHKRTFGERTSSFRFSLNHKTSPHRGSPVKTAVPSTITMSTRPKPTRRARSLFREAAEDIARRRDVEASPQPMRVVKTAEPKDDVQIKVEAVESVTHSPEHRMETPVKSSIVATTATTFQTPVRNAAKATKTTATVFTTPSTAVSAPPSAPATASTTSISPAVAVVHAKDTPGKVDKFEWTIRRTSSSSDRTDALPPPYLRDAASATPKRRVHSSTFGSFARTFSFTTP